MSSADPIPNGCFMDMAVAYGIGNSTKMTVEFGAERFALAGSKGGLHRAAIQSNQPFFRPQKRWAPTK